MNLPNFDEGETLCGENDCRKILKDMEGATCLDCGIAPRYCPEHIVTNPCGVTQCQPCYSNEACNCRACKRGWAEIAAEDRYQTRKELSHD